MTTAGIYIRKSRKEADDKESHRLIVQRQQLPAYATTQGWDYRIYDDGHASAARGKTDDLQERARLQADIIAGRVNLVLCIELSRLSRDDSLQDYVAWLHVCAQHRVRLATLSRILDPAQHSDWMLLLMEGGFSSVEMRVLKQRMQEGWDHAWRAGKFLGGTPPPPYRYDHAAERPVIDPEALPRMQRLWQLAETDSARAIAETLNMPEIAVRRAISDDRLLWYQALRLDPATGQQIACEWVPCMTADQAARIRAGRRTRTKGATRRPWGALLTGLDLLYCGYCGHTVKTWHNSRIRKDGTRNDYYGCQSTSNRRKCSRARLIQQADLDSRILINIFNTLDSLPRLKAYWLQAQTGHDPEKELTDLARRERQTAEKKQRLVRAISEGVIELADAKTEMTAIAADLAEIETSRRTILHQLTAQPEWDLLAIARPDFDQLHQADQREFLQLALQRIDLYESYAIITYPFPRTADGTKTARINLPAPKR
jgi:DNA invertase Pin-like site-specific DNA recombinase